MKKGIIGGIFAALIAIIALIVVLTCSTIVPAGYVGVVYSMNGGVQEEVLQQGWNFIGPMKTVKLFTVGDEQLILSKDSRDGSPEDDSFAVSTADNANIDISFQMSYRYQMDTVVDTYKQFKGMDGEDIISSRVSTVLKSKISEITTDYSMMDIYSGNRSKINDKITAYLNEELGSAYGIEVLDASIIDVHPDEQLQKTIDERVTAMQKKEQAIAEQETIRVQNETKLMQAQAEADAKLIEAQAEAEANKVIAESITPELIEMQEAEARMEHGWVEVQGAGTVVTTTD